MTTIIEKIQKLQALADRAGTEHEAAVAAERVAQLCRQHNLDIGVVTLSQDETEASELRHVHETSRWQAHWSKLAHACGALFNVGYYVAVDRIPVRDPDGVIVSVSSRQVLIFYGLKASVQSADLPVLSPKRGEPA